MPLRHSNLIKYSIIDLEDCVWLVVYNLLFGGTRYLTIRMPSKKQWRMDSACTRFLVTRRFLCTTFTDVKLVIQLIETPFVLIVLKLVTQDTMSNLLDTTGKLIWNENGWVFNSCWFKVFLWLWSRYINESVPVARRAHARHRYSLRFGRPHGIAHAYGELTMQFWFAHIANTNQKLIKCSKSIKSSVNRIVPSKLARASLLNPCLKAPPRGLTIYLIYF